MTRACHRSRPLVPALVSCFIFLFGFSFLPRAAAQKHTANNKTSTSNATKLIAVKASGSTRYTDKEILGASGLRLGQDAADGDFKEAAERLGQSGLFSSVVYSFSFSGAGVKVQFQLADNDKLKFLPAHFDNFVWFTDAELRTALEERVPLFKGSLLPDSGQLADRVNDALQAVLTEKHLPGRVTFLRQSKQEGGELTGIEYRVDEVSIHIRKVEFPGATPDQTMFLAKGARQLTDADYFRSKLAAVAQFDLLPRFLERGYLKAAFGPSEAHVVNGAENTGKAETTDANNNRSDAAAPQADETNAAHANDNDNSSDIEVDVSLPVVSGKVYSVSGVTWKGNAAVTTDEASRVLHLAVGRPADAVRLSTDQESLAKLYRSRGYMTAQIKPDAQLDDDKGEVHYDINVTEGDLYRMGTLEVVGVDSPSKGRLHDAWKLREGQPYNADYTRQFLDDAPGLLPRGLRFSVSVNEELDKKEKLVDVTIQFKVQ
ncbi:MAG: POTRA domain-containing protein [Terriglobales bacterium]|jgi:outer membrane protein assembly factor BamA